MMDDANSNTKDKKEKRKKTVDLSQFEKKYAFIFYDT